MADVFTKAQRSAVMARIRSHGNRDTELALIGLFRRHGVSGWRRHQPVFGRPDFIFKKFKMAVFVDGCFWHSCPKHATRPKNNRLFWRRKLSRNKARDQIVNRTLRRKGWRVIRIWEHDLRKPDRALRRIQREMR